MAYQTIEASASPEQLLVVQFGGIALIIAYLIGNY